MIPPARWYRASRAATLGADAWRELADDSAFVKDEDAIGERQNLLQLERDEQDGFTFVSLLDEALVDEFDRTDVEPARRLSGDQQARVAVDLARQHDLLLVAARQRGAACLRSAAAHVELLQQLASPAEEAPGIEQPEA